MLGNFDTYLLGWKDREFAVMPKHAAHVKEGGGGWIRPVIVRDGKVIGGWRSSRKGGMIEVTLGSPDELPADVGRAIDGEIRDIERFEGIPVKLAEA
jgi:DNA glycosylase AlkZ-like